MQRVACVIVLAACGASRMTGGGGGGGVDAGGSGSVVALPQAIGGAMFVDPIAFPAIPVHVAAPASAASVTVALDGGAAVAAVADGSGAGAWTASVDVSALADGAHQLVATADGATASATLVAGAQDLQFTEIGVDGNAGTPRLHRAGDHLYLTWTDARSGSRVAWLQELDGAGRALGSAVALAGGGAGAPDVLYARTALGAHSFAVLYQQAGGPYDNYFALVAPDGTPAFAAMPLDGSAYGSYGGDVVYDGTSGFDVAWRTNDGSGTSQIEWMHVDEATGAVVQGPLAIATGNFDPIIDVSVEHVGDVSLVAFLRYEDDPTLGEQLDRCHVAYVRDANVAATELAENGAGFWWADDCRILAGATVPVLVWAQKDLDSSADDPPDALVGTPADNGVLGATRGNGALMVNAPDSREDPWLVPTAAAPVLAWTDARSYGSGTTGQVQLYAARVGSDLATTAEVGFASSHVVEGTADVRGVAAGTNAIVTWIDERHGGSVVAPMPEVYFETIWQ